jgi:hypothetical protein
MKSKFYINAIFLSYLSFLTMGCNDLSSKDAHKKHLHDFVKDTSRKRDIAFLPNEKKVLHQLDDFLKKKLQPVQDNFSKINQHKDWTNIEEFTLNTTTEGGLAKFYIQANKVHKIVTYQYAETYKLISEYYFMNDTISFIYEENYTYNRPIYYDTATMLAMKDNEVFDFDKSKITQKRYYFEEGNLFYFTHDNHIESDTDIVGKLAQQKIEDLSIFLKLRKI